MRQALTAATQPTFRPHRPRGLWRFKRAFVVLGAAILALVALTFIAVRLAQAPARALQGAIATEVDSGRYTPDVVRFYTVRGYQPVWLTTVGKGPFGRPTLSAEAQRMLSLAESVGQGAAASRSAIEKAAGGSPAALARAELAASQLLGAYVRKLAPVGAEPLSYVDAELVRPRDTGAVLDQAAAAPSISAYLAAVAEVNPIYRDLKLGLERYRSTWSRLPQAPIPAGPTLRVGDSGSRVEALRVRLGAPSPGADAARYDQHLARAVGAFQKVHGLSVTGELDSGTLEALNAGSGRYEQLILDNLERARSFPPVLAKRFVLVNVAARELWAYEDGQAKHSMRVIVGTRDQQTPSMVGQIRYLIFNPYWNIPVDIVRTSVAPAVLREGTGYLKRSRYQVLSDWSEGPSEIDPTLVNWEDVSRGWRELRVRQLPRGDNMMGRIKFASPNELGIYLHDTPNQAHFQEAQRMLSAGCVRLEHADTLARWLLNGQLPDANALKDDQEAYLEQPTPLYIAYLTAAPSPAGVTFHPDIYGRDKAHDRGVGAP